MTSQALLYPIDNDVSSQAATWVPVSQDREESRALATWEVLEGMNYWSVGVNIAH